MTRLSDTPDAIKSVNEELKEIKDMLKQEQPFTKFHATFILIFTSIMAVCSVLAVIIQYLEYLK